MTLILLITSISFTAFSFSPLDPQFRCQVIALLMLTLVNFRWVITQRLPSVSYLTMLDKYSIGSIIFLFISFLWHSMIGSRAVIKSEMETKRFDKYFFLFYIALYFIFNLLFLFLFLKLYLNIRTFIRKNSRKTNVIKQLSTNYL